MRWDVLEKMATYTYAHTRTTHLPSVAVKDGEEGPVWVPHEVATNQEAVLVGLVQGVRVVAWVGAGGMGYGE